MKKSEYAVDLNIWHSIFKLNEIWRRNIMNRDYKNILLSIVFTRDFWMNTRDHEQE